MHPQLADRFHSDYPDDLQVIVHDGGPRTTSRRPELVWVRVTGCDGNVFRGTVLNMPTNLARVGQGQNIRFIVAAGAPSPILVTARYLAERDSWTIHPCDKCGFSELLDSPSELMRVVFPNLPADATMQAFTTFCPFCGGVQTIESKATADSPAPPPESPSKWWQLWKSNPPPPGAL